MTGTDDDNDVMPNDPSLGDLIRGLRGSLSQKDFGNLVGISPSMIGHVEAGSRALSVENVERLTDALDLDGAQSASLRQARDRLSNSLRQHVTWEDQLGVAMGRLNEARWAVERDDNPTTRRAHAVARDAVNDLREFAGLSRIEPPAVKSEPSEGGDEVSSPDGDVRQQVDELKQVVREIALSLVESTDGDESLAELAASLRSERLARLKAAL